MEVVDIVCQFCKKNNVVKFNREDFFDWTNGKLIQDAFPYLSVSERELIKTRICPSCWNRIFNDDE